MDISGQDFFIDCNGKLIKIDKNLSIDEFVIEHLKILSIDLETIYKKIIILQPKYKNLDLTYRDLIVDILGYVLYSYRCGNLDIELPYFDINHREVTNEQLVTILKLLKVNKESEISFYKLLIDMYDLQQQSSKVKSKYFDNNISK
ncbi:MAG: hypothetical protein NC181_03775 [Clostridium sp.]|nr:hypothetical protein [Clostridium sp.]MCM1444260.1 hypothetical protein [Candidatus Amulumruptor caecigallinarius]